MSEQETNLAVLTPETLLTYLPEETKAHLEQLPEYHRALALEMILTYLPEEMQANWAQLPEDARAFLINAQVGRLRKDFPVLVRRIAQRDPNLSEEERNQIIAKLTVDIADKQMKPSDVFEVGGAEPNPASAWQQPQPGWLVAGCLIVAIRFLLQGGSIGSLVIITVLVIAAVLSAVLLSARLAKNDKILVVDKDTLRWNSQEWRWQDITEIRLLRFGRIRIFAGDQTICTLSITDKNADRLVRHAEMLGITVTGED